jgi:hypothetical protein
VAEAVSVSRNTEREEARDIFCPKAEVAFLTSRYGENKILELNITSATIPRTTTMGAKRPHAAMDAQDSTANQSPFMPMFEGFRAELDEHHDRRERIIKSSRDITASSKKM